MPLYFLVNYFFPVFTPFFCNFSQHFSTFRIVCIELKLIFYFSSGDLNFLLQLPKMSFFLFNDSIFVRFYIESL